MAENKQERAVINDHEQRSIPYGSLGPSTPAPVAQAPAAQAPAAATAPTPNPVVDTTTPTSSTTE